MISKNTAIFIYCLILLFILGLLGDKYGWLEKVNYGWLIEKVQVNLNNFPELKLEKEVFYKPIKEGVDNWFRIDALTGKYLLALGLSDLVQPVDNASTLFVMGTRPYQMVIKLFKGVFDLGMRPSNVYLGEEMPVISYISPEIIVSNGDWELGNAEVVITEPTENFPPELEYETKKVKNINSGQIEVDYHLNEGTRVANSNRNQQIVNVPEKREEKQQKPGSQREIIPEKPPVKTPERKPLVLIYHTHTSETYSDDPRPMDKHGHIIPPGSGRGQIVEVGHLLAQKLNEKGIMTEHITDIFDSSYSMAYLNSRKSVKDFLEENPQVEMVLDLHRDALDNPSPQELKIKINGREAARIMILVTQGSFGLSHPEWERNLFFAQKLARRIQERYPGLLRRLEIRRERRYNQDLHPHALLIEFGGFKNSLEQALYSAELLSQVLVEMLAGS